MYTQPVDVSRTKPRRPAVVPESHGCATHVFRLGAQVSRTIRKHQDQSTARTRTTCPRYPRSTQAPQSRASTEAAVRSGGRPELARCAVIAGSMDPNPGLLHSIPPLPESDKQSGILFFCCKTTGKGIYGATSIHSACVFFTEVIPLQLRLRNRQEARRNTAGVGGGDRPTTPMMA